MLGGGDINIINCSNEGNIGKECTWNCGGMVGTAERSVGMKLYNCYNKGEIGGNSTYASGGIVGSVYKVTTLVMEKCYSTGNIKGINPRIGGVFRSYDY